MEDQLVQATWGLVIATSLLVIGTMIPLVTEALRRRDEKTVVVTRAVPDLNILRSRLEGSEERLGAGLKITPEELTRLAEGVHEDLKLLAPLIDVRDASLKFTNELFIMRHLLTFAHDSIHSAEELADEAGAEAIAKRAEALQSARRAYRAALLTLDAAEALLPRRVRTVDGERFWDRFARISDQRENEAAQEIARGVPIQRTQKRTS